MSSVWATVVIVWLAGALYNARHASREPIRADLKYVTQATAAFLAAPSWYSLGGASRRTWSWTPHGCSSSGSPCFASTAFALWARFSLGTSWSLAPQVGGDRRLRTEGPYRVTRHPIYTGLLGMLLGSALLGGLGQGILIVVVGLTLFSVKIQMRRSGRSWRPFLRRTRRTGSECRS